MINKVLAFGALSAILAVPAVSQAAPMDKSNTEMQQHQSMPAAKGAMDNNMTNGSADANRSSMDKNSGSMQAVQRPGFMQEQGAGEWRASKLIGASVTGPDNKSIGDINEIIFGRDGELKAVVIGVGGFLGMGEKNVAVPFDALTVARKPDSDAIEKVTVTYTKDQLKNAPKFAYYDGERSTRSTTTGMKPVGSPPVGTAQPPSK